MFHGADLIVPRVGIGGEMTEKTAISGGLREISGGLSLPREAGGNGAGGLSMRSKTVPTLADSGFPPLANISAFRMIRRHEKSAPVSKGGLHGITQSGFPDYLVFAVFFAACLVGAVFAAVLVAFFLATLGAT